MIKIITSKENQKIKFACSLKDNKNRKKEKLFLAETFKALEMALIHNRVVEVFSLKELDIPSDIPQYIVSEEILKKLSSNVNPEGVVFISKIVEEKDKEYNKILYLDKVSDPGNVGTLIRTALAFNYDAVVLSEGSCSIYNEKVVNSTKGAIFAIPVFNENILKFQNSHQIIVSALLDDAVDLEKVKFKDKFVLVLGSESHGVSEEILKIADVKVVIPIKNIDSLNVAVAGGILMNKIH